MQEKGKGTGNWILQILTGLADANAVTLYVIPARVFDEPGALTDEQLATWYASHDFVRAPTADTPRLMRRDPRTR